MGIFNAETQRRRGSQRKYKGGKPTYVSPEGSSKKRGSFLEKGKLTPDLTITSPFSRKDPLFLDGRLRRKRRSHPLCEPLRLCVSALKWIEKLYPKRAESYA